MGMGAFEYDTGPTFEPATAGSTPPQGNDAKCGFGATVW